MNKPQALITYDGLPISSGGAHTIRARDHRAIWNKMSKFFETFTIRDSADEIHLVLYEGQNTDQMFFSKAYKQIAQVCGLPKRSVAVSGAVEEHQNRWELQSNRISEAIDLMASLEPFPKHWLGAPVFLGIKSRFRLVDPDSSHLLPFQGNDMYGGQEASFGLPLGLSVLYLRLAHPSTCSLFLSLPFATITPEVKNFAQKMEDVLPFTLSRKHWSRWQLNSKGTRYYSRKVSM